MRSLEIHLRIPGGVYCVQFWYHCAHGFSVCYIEFNVSVCPDKTSTPVRYRNILRVVFVFITYIVIDIQDFCGIWIISLTPSHLLLCKSAKQELEEVPIDISYINIRCPPAVSI